MRNRKGNLLKIAWFILALFCPRGEAYASLVLASSLSVSEAYSDNIFFSETNPQTDYFTSISPKASLRFESRSVTLSLGYRGIVSLYSMHPEENGYEQSVSFGLGLPILSRRVKGLEVRVVESLSYSPELKTYTFNDEVEEGGEEGVGGEAEEEIIEPSDEIQVERRDSWTNRAGINLGYPMSRRLRLNASYINVITVFPDLRDEDTVVDKVRAGARYLSRQTPQTDWTTTYRFAVTFYSDAEEVLKHELNLEVRHRIRAPLTINGKMGVVFIHGEYPLFVYGAVLVKQYETAQASIAYSNGISTGERIIKGAIIRQKISASASKNFKRSMVGFISLVYGNTRSVSGGDVDVTTVSANTGLSIQFWRWLNGNLSYKYFNQRSQGSTGRDVERNLFLIGLTSQIPQWRIFR